MNYDKDAASKYAAFVTDNEEKGIVSFNVAMTYAFLYDLEAVKTNELFNMIASQITTEVIRLQRTRTNKNA